jgi:uncharacterized protein YhaN
MKSKVSALILLALSVPCWSAEKKTPLTSTECTSAGTTEEEIVGKAGGKLVQREFPLARDKQDPRYRQLVEQIAQEERKLQELREALRQHVRRIPIESRAVHDSKSPFPEKARLEFEFAMAEVTRNCHVISLVADRLGQVENQKVRSLLLKGVQDHKLKVQAGLDSAVKRLEEVYGTSQKSP